MRGVLVFCVVQVITLAIVTAAMLGEEPQVGLFSQMEPAGSPKEWEPLPFASVGEETAYALVEHDGRVVLQAESRRSASALLKKVSVDLGRHPYLSWSWKTHDECFSGNWRRPDIDDYPLRMFVIFEPSGGVLSFFKRLRPGFSGDAILYVADSSAVPGVDPASHLSDRIKVVPLSGPERNGRAWGRHVRNVRADYGELFGGEPQNVAAVAVMTDTDNSRTECVSYYGDIAFTEDGA
jgi:hypothetical protein